MKAAVATVIVAFAVVVVFAVAPIDMPPVTSELTAEEKVTEFLSSVVGFDFAEYALVVPTPPSGIDPERWAEIGASAEARRLESLYPPEYCGLVKDEWFSPQFEAGGSNISIMSNCFNGLLRTLKVSNLGGNYLYSEPQPATDILSQAKTILQRYKAYVTQVDAMDSSYLMPMQEILNSVDELSPANFTVGNVNFEVSENGDRTLIKWIYTENGVSMEWKRVDLAFRNSAFESFHDTWRIYGVGAFSVINSEEARNIALEAAQNLEFRIVNEYRNETVTLPDLSNSVYQMYFTMLPYRNETSHNPSKIPRDPLKLYPYWQFYFYFPGGEIGGYSGIQVGIWGDTKETIYCNGFGFHNFS